MRIQLGIGQICPSTANLRSARTTDRRRTTAMVRRRWVLLGAGTSALAAVVVAASRHEDVAPFIGPMVAYALPAALITALPGPDTAMVLTTALRAGRRAAARAAWGVGTGLLVWGTAAAV